jgi:membrane protein YqaA with SNARE-associated domain
MKRLIVWAQAFVLAYGGPGLFVVAFLDASFLSLPEINDILIVWLVTRYPQRLVYYASMATLGSVAGCLALYWLARKGGEAFMRRRFNAERVERATRTIQRYGLLAVLVPSMLPPPSPLKLFVLMAGVARVRPASFALAIGVGRGLRYLAEGLLAAWYGEMALDYIQRHGDRVALWAAAVVLVAGLAVLGWSRLRTNRAARAHPPTPAG